MFHISLNIRLWTKWRLLPNMRRYIQHAYLIYKFNFFFCKELGVFLAKHFINAMIKIKNNHANNHAIIHEIRLIWSRDQTSSITRSDYPTLVGNGGIMTEPTAGLIQRPRNILHDMINLLPNIKENLFYSIYHNSSYASVT